MSERRRAEFSVRGQVYLLVREWALPLAGLAGYVRVEPERAVELLAGVPAVTSRQVDLAGMLGGPRSGSLGSRSLGRGRASLQGFVLFQRASVNAQVTGPEQPSAPVVVPWEPEEPPMLAPVIELGAQAAIAATLLAAAANGAPFCEMCENCE